MPAYNCSPAEGPFALSRTGHPPPLLSAFLLALSSALLALAIASCASSHASDSIAIVQAAFDRLAEGDVDGYLAYYTEDAIFLVDEGPFGRDIAREILVEDIAHEYRYEMRDPRSDGNVVIYTMEVFSGDTSVSTDSNAVAVVIDNKIIFWSPYEWRLLDECERDPSQPFCISD